MRSRVRRSLKVRLTAGIVLTLVGTATVTRTHPADFERCAGYGFLPSSTSWILTPQGHISFSMPRRASQDVTFVVCD